MKRKYLNQTLAVLFSCLLIFASCKKDDEIRYTPSAALNVVNATVGSANLKYSFNRKFYSINAAATAYGASSLFWLEAGKDNALKIATVSDSLTVLYNNSLRFGDREYHSLYLTGVAPTAEATLLKDPTPPVFTDSTFAVRIVNMLQGTEPVNVTLASSATVNEFSNVPFKQGSDYKSYSAKTGVSNTAYNFQFRQADGTLIVNYAFSAANLTAARYKAATLVLRGVAEGTGASAPAVSFILNY